LLGGGVDLVRGRFGEGGERRGYVVVECRGKKNWNVKNYIIIETNGHEKKGFEVKLVDTPL